MNNCVCVIGGANIDISGTPYASLNKHDSNPGKINTSLGGVGRNIAENLSRMGVQVEFISLLADDNYARDIIESCNELGIGLRYSQQIENERTSIYLCINDPNGEMQLAISDMELYNKITPVFLQERIHILNSSKACIADTNIPQESLEFLIENLKVPLFIDTVSVKKTEKLKNSIRDIYALKPNIHEAEILTDIKITSKDDLDNASNILLNKGIKNVYISLGPEGVYYSNGRNKGILPSITDEIINTTGAGDSFLAAVVWAYLNNYDIEESAKAGSAASYICIRSPKTVSDEISEAYIRELMDTKWRS
jgi:pseudouridine kinase